jgi:hypothetical protein
LANSFLISIYTATSAFRGISDISSLKPAAAAIDSTADKHQILASSSCFPQLLSHSPPATAAFQQQQPKQTDPYSSIATSGCLLEFWRTTYLII